jgi:choline dehydrogenase
MLKHPITKVKAGLEWFLFQSGVCSSNHFESGGFIRSDKGV